MLHTTFALAHKANACTGSYRKMAKVLGGVSTYGEDTPIPLTKIVEVCGLQDALWALRCTRENSDRLARLFACDCAERVLPIWEKQYPASSSDSFKFLLQTTSCVSTSLYNLATHRGMEDLLKGYNLIPKEVIGDKWDNVFRYKGFSMDFSKFVVLQPTTKSEDIVPAIRDFMIKMNQWCIEIDKKVGPSHGSILFNIGDKHE